MRKIIDNIALAVAMIAVPVPIPFALLLVIIFGSAWLGHAAFSSPAQEHQGAIVGLGPSQSQPPLPSTGAVYYRSPIQGFPR